MRAIRQSDRSRTTADFLHGDDVFEIAEAGPAPLFFHRDAVQAKRTHVGPELARKHVRAIDLFGDGRDLVLGESANRLAQRVRGFAEIVFQRAIVGSSHARLQYDTRGLPSRSSRTQLSAFALRATARQPSLAPRA